MITSKLPNGRVFQHNGDFSGDLLINFEQAEIQTIFDVPPGQSPCAQARIPFDDVKAIVAEYVARKIHVALENASDDDILLGKITPTD